MLLISVSVGSLKPEILTIYLSPLKESFVIVFPGDELKISLRTSLGSKDEYLLTST